MKIRKSSQENTDADFGARLEYEFLSDLLSAYKLTSVHPWDLNKMEKDILEFLRKKYSERKCPSTRYQYASRELKIEYFKIHSRIDDVINENILN